MVDGHTVFVSSANFTEAAQERNIEIGLHVKSPASPSRSPATSMPSQVQACCSGLSEVWRWAERGRCIQHCQLSETGSSLPYIASSFRKRYDTHVHQRRITHPLLARLYCVDHRPAVGWHGTNLRGCNACGEHDAKLSCLWVYPV
ncbi:MAG: hypothetical protein ACQESR_30775 [Planctomycetota bacterium]